MRFLRGDGPDIFLDQVMQNYSGDGSSSSSDATSELMEECARFEAARNRCANVLIFGRKDLPGDVFVRATATAITWSSPIIIPALTLSAPNAQSSSNAITGMEIVPWQLVRRDILALQLWPLIVDCHRTPTAPSGDVSVIMLGEASEIQVQAAGDSAASTLSS